ncbi:phosphopantetheine-binding protein [Campylobacter jejuni]|uniref:phosphopantetheine-binding protein n=1 Tax=Campylobacter jejuni TaxID=197 RepID=UPI0006997AB2|nr:acyl carrier protein [Campylobacter jejuni]RTJ10054.1 acyl carrier protein [Campylobacter jejuni]RTJ49748.1 acyl carrier protein [Campylobacter jejuni]HEF3798033.1 acyl carrier protein [Campylobacter jejuni]
MHVVKSFFENIGKGDVDETCEDLISLGVVDSLTIMALVGEIEKYYGVEVDFDYLVPENFINFRAIEGMINQILK